MLLGILHCSDTGETRSRLWALKKIFHISSAFFREHILFNINGLVLTHWRYCSLALNHRYFIQYELQRLIWLPQHIFRKRSEHTATWIELQTFCRQYFQIYFLERKCLIQIYICILHSSGKGSDSDMNSESCLWLPQHISCKTSGRHLWVLKSKSY